MEIAQLKATYDAISNELRRVAKDIEANMLELFEGTKHIDRITCRVKTRDSFLTKATKTNGDGSQKYCQPFREVQDFIGCRIVVYYKSDVEVARQIVDRFYDRIEHQHLVPDDAKTFGYEGTHIICSIPSPMYPSPALDSFPDFFELQIKTLFQHSWSQAEHGLGYKPGAELSAEEKRKLAFIAAQSWGADTLLDEILNAQNDATDDAPRMLSDL